ncbi:MAG: hypothetical protein H0U73_02380 [Tatlockia sp.]|nr:hypothetical protein [Tatlockia sp.]
MGVIIGWRIQDNQALKISGEYLRQDIIYSFFSGNSREWVQQGAIGAHYQYGLYQFRFLPEFNLKAGYSHAPSKNLDPFRGSAITSSGLIIENFLNDRRIAGSDAGYVSPGVSVQPWYAARVGVELNYDNVEYDRIFGFGQHAKGLGGTANFTQRLGENTNFGCSVGVRDPFNAYQANIAYTLPNKPNWSVGVGANYVDGKHYLPNTYNVGISVSYLVKEVQFAPNYLEKDPIVRPVQSGFSSWVAEPAIYLPQVLAISDEKIFVPVAPPTPCTGVTLIGAIPDQSTTTQITIATAPFFSGSSPLNFSVTFVPPPPDSGVEDITVTIDPSTGVLTIIPGAAGEEYTFPVTVTARNACGTASTTFTVVAPFIG